MPSQINSVGIGKVVFTTLKKKDGLNCVMFDCVVSFAITFLRDDNGIMVMLIMSVFDFSIWTSILPIVLGNGGGS